uniref:Uncharacterized protein n=1 Tax=Glossina austeni TaxID=7395 RepID=A0A1A9US89_GLOAU
MCQSNRVSFCWLTLVTNGKSRDWRETCSTCWALLRMSGTDDEIFAFELFRLSKLVFEVKCSFRLFILLQLIIVGDSLLDINSRSFGRRRKDLSALGFDFNHLFCDSNLWVNHETSPSLLKMSFDSETVIKSSGSLRTFLSISIPKKGPLSL